VHGNIQIFDDVDSLLDTLLMQWQSVGVESIADHEAFHVALAGGSTPRSFYAELAKAEVKGFVPWSKVHLYFGDERCVPQDHKDSNYRMAHEVLVSQVAIPASQVHAMYPPFNSAKQRAKQNTGKNAKESAAYYSELLEKKLSKDTDGNPVFDLILLGMGEDGHTASLFPDTEILSENRRSVSAQYVDKLAAWRVSLTFSAINAARHVAILVVGDSKASVLSELSKLPTSDVRYPIQQVNPQGDLQWYLDKSAASLLVSGRR